MHPISSLPSALINSAGKPPAALLFLSRIIPNGTSSWLGGGISSSSAIGVIGVFSPALMLLPVSNLEKISLHNLSVSCGSVTRFPFSSRQLVHRS